MKEFVIAKPRGVPESGGASESRHPEDLLIAKPELLPRFRAGDRAALEEVYWAYVDAVYAVARRAIGPDAARDVVQETFERAFRQEARLSYDGLRPYRPYLLTICRNRLSDWTRRESRLPVEVDFDATNESDLADSVDPTVLALVDRYVEELPSQLAGVYQQRYVIGASQEEAARTLGLSRQQVRTLEEKLRRGLRRALRCR